MEEASRLTEAESRSTIPVLSGTPVIDARLSELVTVGPSVTSGSIVLASRVASILVMDAAEASDRSSVLMGVSEILVG